jgi:hypothetical protein
MIEPSRSTGDLSNAIGKLGQILSREPFKSGPLPGCSTTRSVLSTLEGGADPVAALRILHHYSLTVSPELADYLLQRSGQPLLSATDQRFVEEILRVARNDFKYKPSLTVAQFLSFGFYSEQRILLLADLLHLMEQKAHELTRSRTVTRRDLEGAMSKVLALGASGSGSGGGQPGDLRMKWSERSLAGALSKHLGCETRMLLPFKPLIAQAARRNGQHHTGPVSVLESEISGAASSPQVPSKLKPQKQPPATASAKTKTRHPESS